MRQRHLQAPLLWISWLLFWICGVLAALWPVPGFICAALIILADRRLWKFFRILVCVALCGLSFGVAHWRIHSFYDAVQHPPAWAAGQTAKRPPRFSAEVVASEWRQGGSLRLLLENVRPAGNGEKPEKGAGNAPDGGALPGLCLWVWENPLAAPLPGQTVSMERRIRAVHGASNFPVPSHEISWAIKGVYWRVWSRGDAGNPKIEGKAFWHARLRQKLRGLFLKALMQENSGNGASPHLSQAKAILLALIFGDRSGLARESLDNFAWAALAHSLALSGQHLCVAAFLAFLLVAGAARQYPQIYLSRPKKILIALVTLPLAFLYLWIGDSPPSLVRAFCMALILAVWLWRSAIFSILDLLAGALAIILLFQPLAILDAGLQMSALCIAVIALSLPALGRISPTRPGARSFRMRLMIRGVQIFMTSLIIQFALMPISLARFQTAGFWFPLNVIWLPVLGAFILPLAALGLVLASLSFAIGLEPARLVLDAAAMPCGYMLKTLEHLRDFGVLEELAFLMPHWSVFLAYAALAIALAWIFGGRLENKAKNKARGLVLLALVLLAIGPVLRLGDALSGKIVVEALDVGQGMAAHLKLPGGCRILIDGGGSLKSGFDPGRSLVAPALADNASPRLDAVINTHPDLDHLGGLFHILGSFRVGEVFHNGREAANDAREKWLAAQKLSRAHVAAAGDVIILGDPGRGISLEILHPPLPLDERAGKGRWSGNNASLVMRLSRDGEGLALITGDAEKQTLQYLRETEVDLKARVLFLPHHGSDRSYDPRFYEDVAPDMAIASCGFHNRWQYPGLMVGKWFEKQAIPLLDTGTRGRISVVFEAGKEPLASSTRD